MKRVALVSGVAKQVKYNQMLTKKYEDLGYEVKHFKFNTLYLFSHHLRKNLDHIAIDIVENHDVIHAQSGGFFPILPHYVNQHCKKPFIMESPVLRSTTGTLFSGLSLAKSYKEVKDNRAIQKMLDTVCFTETWVQKVMGDISSLRQQGQLLLLGSHEDTVSDNRGFEDRYHHMFFKGKHARLFYENDFKVIEDFLRNYKQQQ